MACGSGYGAALLLSEGAAQRVDGLDSSSIAIELANQLPASDRLCFKLGDATRLNAAPETYDVYVSFETIEHVADDAMLLSEAKRVLKKGGKLLLSTPNRQVVNPGKSIADRPMNRFHVREYAKEELAERLARHFDNVEWYGQTYCWRPYVAALNRLGARVPRLAARVHQFQKVIGMTYRRPGSHEPRPWPPGYLPEVLIAVCTKAA